ncbi:HAMP domain-containing histidine kinase [Paenibacillus sp. P26]|nr:HAMP domain-containing histidine kinase [Paenibacillus sp. P26]
MQTDPDRFADSTFLARADEQLNRTQAGLVVMRSGGASYISPWVDSAELKERLERLQEEPERHPWGKRINGRYAAEAFDIRFSDGSSGVVYLLSDMTPFIDSARKFFPLLLLSLLGVIGLTNGILTFMVSRSFVKPLYRLRRAAEQMKEGHLDQQVDLQRKDEIGELGAAFEEMRRRLSESIRLQLRYEDNRKRLISSISHDLKTPITGIKACVEGIRDGVADTAPKREKYMDMIARKTEEMDRLIDESLLFSQLDMKRSPFHLEPVDLAEYLRAAVKELRLDPRLKGVRLELAGVQDGPVPVAADRDKLHRVWMNIIDNSLKYMDKEHKEITVELYDGETEAEVHIRDNGPGIADAAAPHIFDRFYRAEPSRSTATGGAGWGSRL